MDSPTGMSSLQNQTQYKKLEYDCQNRFSIRRPCTRQSILVGYTESYSVKTYTSAEVHYLQITLSRTNIFMVINK